MPYPDQNGSERRKGSGWLDLKTAVLLGTTLVAIATAWGTSQAEIRVLRERLDEMKSLPAVIAKLETSVAVLAVEVRYLRADRVSRDSRRDVP